ncbi:MAG: alpha/beta hydrolase domain-containing protein, partial [bacterium]|nr:alpha/beta hydrolase domain-containing protein [bacterium]
MDSQIRLIIDTREPFAAGTGFGRVGAYEKWVGRVEFAINPQDPAYQGVVDLEYAPREASGRVTFSTDLCILKPSDLARGNHRLIYDVNNRGNKRLLRDFNDAPENEGNSTGNNPSTLQDAGNGFLMRYGYTIVWSGWQGDILPGAHRLTMRLPVATDEGQDLTGIVRTELMTEQPNTVWLPLSGNDYTLSYESVSLDTAAATLTCREHESDARMPITSDAWQFARLDEHGTVMPSTTHCYLPAGFKPGWLYELIYTAKNPPLMGLGFIGIRDLIAFLIHADTDADGTPNPLQKQGVRMEKAYAWGISQSGRLLREFVYRGWNADAQGRRVFDAVSPDVSGGGRVTLNYRFAQPGRYPRQHSDHLYPSDQFPFAYAVITDPLTARTDGILKRPETDPLVLHTQSSAEYWERRGSLVHTDPLGNDLADHEHARVYLFASAPHGPFPQPDPGDMPYVHAKNLLKTTPLLRALLVALDAWATDGTPPPPSHVPTRADASAVSADEVRKRFPTLPGVVCPGEPNRLYVQSFGPDFERGVFSKDPPEEDKDREYTVWVPQIDTD